MIDDISARACRRCCRACGRGEGRGDEITADLDVEKSPPSTSSSTPERPGEGGNCNLTA